MKKNIGIVLLAAAIVAVTAVLYFQSKKAADSARFAEYLPQDSLAAISVTHLDRMSEDFGASPLGRLLAKETMEAILTEMRAPSRDIDEYNQVYDDIAAVMSNPAFRAVFGDDVSLGVLRPGAKALKSDPEKELRRVLLVFATTPVPGALEKFARLVVSEQVSEETVDGVALTRIVIDERTVMYGYAEDGIVLLAYEPHTITAGLAVRESGTGLAGSTPFQEVVGFWQPFAPENVLSRMFFNPGSLKGLLKETGEPETMEFAAYLEGVRYIASVTHEDREGLHSESRAGFTHNELHDVVKQAIAGQADVNTTLHMLREQCLAYDWASTLAPEVLTQSMGAAGDQEMRRANRLLQRELGVTLDEFFQAFGPQYGFVVNEIVNGGFIPIPKVVAFVEVRDHAAATKVYETVREKISEMGLAEEKQLEVDDEVIHYWSILPGEATQPAMLLTKDMLYLANGTSSLVRMLRAGASRSVVNPQVAALLGKRGGHAVESARLGAFVIYPARLADDMGEVAQWIMNTVTAAQGVSVERLGKEILELMRAYEVLSATSSLSEEHGEWRVSLKRKAAGTEE